MKKLFPQETLKMGAKGPAVRFLKILAEALQLNPELLVDDHYDKELALAVRNFQADMRIPQHGDFDKETGNGLSERIGTNIYTLDDFSGETTVLDEIIEGQSASRV